MTGQEWNETVCSLSTFGSWSLSSILNYTCCIAEALLPHPGPFLTIAAHGRLAQSRSSLPPVC